VIANLVSNAIKYAPDGEIKISGTVRPEQVVICVSDEGAGIEARDQPHIFDRFYRSTNAVKQTKGAGLGLYGGIWQTNQIRWRVYGSSVVAVC
jgi:signal transduction histidine kinase